jgi:hypothetical protein
MVNIPIWFAATAVMFHFDSGAAPFAAALVIAFVIAHFQNKTRKIELQQLVSQYAQAYGAPPPSFSAAATGTGWAVGSVVGDPVAGGLLGVAFDLAKNAFDQRRMSDEQKRLHNRIRGLSAWSPYLGVYVLVLSLGMSWGVLALMHG